MVRFGAQRIPQSTLLLLFLDAASVVIGLLAAISLRLRGHVAIAHYLSGPHIIPRFALVILVSGVAVYYSDLYERNNLNSGIEVFMGLLQALGSACLVLAMIYYWDEDISLGRGIAAMSGPAVFALMLGSRAILSKTSLLLYGPKRVLVVGTGSTGISAVREIISRPELNLKVEGFLDERGENIGKSLVNPGIIGAVGEVESIVRDRRIDSIILSLKERRGNMPVSELLHLKFGGVEVEDAHSFIEKVTGRIHLEHLSPSWLILSDGFRKSQFLYAVKRSFDIVISLVALVLTLPLMILVAIAIWLESGGPVLFRQERTGFKGGAFKIMKFRSMCHSAEEAGPVWAASDDKRVTRIGRFIRKYRLDELPQIINVLRGEMSLVGPRPERPHFCELLGENIPLFQLRHTVRPGITGWAQVKYQYGASVEESKTKLEYDFFYIKHMSIVLDLAILFETAKVMIYGRGAK
jgi:sugar transferase (PEP-CTERM system associated)